MLLKRLTGLILVCAAASALAQDTELPQYQVEILVVRNLNPTTGSELFPGVQRLEESLPGDEALGPKIREPKLTDSRNLQPQTEVEDPELEDELEAANFLPAEADQLDLADMVEKISRSRNFRPLSHSGWIQPGFSREEAKRKIYLRTAETGETVSGSVVLTRERYLRLAFDLTLEVDGELFYLNTQRRMISRQTHYFDHPYFGVIAKITPR